MTRAWRACLLAVLLLVRTGGAAAQDRPPTTVEARLTVAADTTMLELVIAPGWSLIAVDDTLTGRALEVAWAGSGVLPRPAPPGVTYETPVGSTVVYRDRVRFFATGVVEHVRVRYVACSDVCTIGAVEVRPEPRRRLRE